MGPRNWILLHLLVLSLSQLFCVSAQFELPQKTYYCEQKNDGSSTCQLNDPANGNSGVSHGTCLATCGSGNLWPYPTGSFTFGKSVNSFAGPYQFEFYGLEEFQDQKLLDAMNKNFLIEIKQLVKSPSSSAKKVGSSEKNKFLDAIRVETIISDLNTSIPSTENDESYSLSILPPSSSTGTLTVSITAKTIFGYRHALETLAQLCFWDDIWAVWGLNNNVQIENDKPTFPYRGIMVDVSRNFISMSKLKETIRGLGYNKMNVLHLHLSDTASFPVSIPSQPNVTNYGAYDYDKIFSIADMEELVSFAASYGVMILPEIDAPAHMSAGWQWGPSANLGNLIVCDDAYGNEGTQWNTDAYEPPSGQLNLANENSYRILNDIYRDVIRQIPSPVFHIGGDEVVVGSDETWASCYNNSVLGKEIVDFIESQGLSRDDTSSFYSLWENFTMRATAMIQQIYKDKNLPLTKLHIWGGGGVDSSHVIYNLMEQENLEEFLPPDLFTIQVWDTSDGSITPELIGKGYSVILSNTDYVYLDCGNAGFTNAGGYWCQPYHEWYHIYQYIADAQKKWKLTDEQLLKGVSGSETLIWTEMVDDQNLSQKLWPRSAALAEALWSNPQAGWYEASARMQQWRNTLVARGVAAEALQPFWCQQRDGMVCNVNSGTPQ
jgi:hexosaminidase